MKKALIISFLIGVCSLSFAATTVKERVFNTPKLKWWQDARFGMFIHWGPVTLTGKEIGWSRASTGINKYDSLYLRFNPVKFNAEEWVRIAQNAGMKYMVFTAKHMDGFCNWDTKTTNYNIMNSPFKRDVCRELADAAHAAGMPICWYFITPDWKDSDCRNPNTPGVFEKRILEQLTELLTNYGKISLLWTDYDGFAPPTTASKVYELANRLQPGIIVNNRLDVFHTDESHAYIGDNGDYATPENFVAGYGAIPWETCTNLGHQWAWKFNDKPRDMRESTATLLRCVGGNGNLLLNIGPDSLGQFPANFIERLNEIGAWIKPRSSSVYNVKGGPYTPATDYVSSYSGKTFYLHIFNFGNSDTLTIPAFPAKIRKATLVNNKSVSFLQKKNCLQLIIPKAEREQIVTTIAFETNQSIDKVGLIIPFGTSGSLAYGKKVTASSSVGQFLHDANSAVDDNFGSNWKLGRKKGADFDKYIGTRMHYINSPNEFRELYDSSGWLEVDLGKKQTVSAIRLSESKFPNSKITSFEVQYKKGNTWISIAKDEKMEKWERNISPVEARYFRLVIHNRDGAAGINEFQLFTNPIK
jgi:alpha-L-fucosidase